MKALGQEWEIIRRKHFPHISLECMKNKYYASIHNKDKPARPKQQKEEDLSKTYSGLLSQIRRILRNE